MHALHSKDLPGLPSPAMLVQGIYDFVTQQEKTDGENNDKRWYLLITAVEPFLDFGFQYDRGSAWQINLCNNIHKLWTKYKKGKIYPKAQCLQSVWQAANG